MDKLLVKAERKGDAQTRVYLGANRSRRFACGSEGEAGGSGFASGLWWRSLSPLVPSPTSCPRTWWCMGGIPQGVVAAVAAASRGLWVVLLEPAQWVGGSFSQSGMNTFDLTWDSTGELMYGGLTREFVRRMGSYDGVDVRRAERVLRDLLQAAGVTPSLGWRLLDVEVGRNRVLSASFSTPQGHVVVAADNFVDATDLVHLAAAAGARFSVGREDTDLDRRSMAATLAVRLRGLLWAEISAAACPSRPCPDGSGRRPALVWGFNAVVSRYIPGEPSRFPLRGLELALQGDASVLLKGVQVFGVDATDPDSLAAADRQAQAEAARVVRYLRTVAPHLFGTAELVGVAPALYVRKSGTWWAATVCGQTTYCMAGAFRTPWR